VLKSLRFVVYLLTAAFHGIKVYLEHDNSNTATNKEGVTIDGLLISNWNY
jgi:hypothetical protein